MGRKTFIIIQNCSLYKDLVSLQRIFWWGQNDRYRQTLSGKRLCVQETNMQLRLKNEQYSSQKKDIRKLFCQHVFGTLMNHFINVFLIRLS